MRAHVRNNTMTHARTPASHLVAAISLLFLVPGPRAIANEYDAPRTELSPRALRALAALEEARLVGTEIGDVIWPGYRIEDIPIAIFDEEQAYLVHHPAPPQGFAEVPCANLSTPLFVGPRAANMVANYAAPIAGSISAMISMNTMGDVDAPIPASAIGLIVHESGHAFCLRGTGDGQPRWGLESSDMTPSYPLDLAENHAWGRIEGQLLRAALDASDVETVTDLALDFLAVRQVRQALLPAGYAEYEALAETNEGLATYFAQRALAQVDGAHTIAPAAVEHSATMEGYGPSGSYARSLRSRLSTLCRDGVGVQRQRFYDSGAAIGLVLDVIEPEWKLLLEEEHSTPQAMLALILGVEDYAGPGPSASRLKRIGEAYDFAGLLVAEQAAVKTASRTRLRTLLDVLESAQPLLVLDLRAVGGGRRAMFDPLNIVPVTPAVSVHPRMLGLSFDGGHARFEVPVVQDTERMLVVIELPPDAERAYDASTGSLSWTGAGLNLTCVSNAPRQAKATQEGAGTRWVVMVRNAQGETSADAVAIDALINEARQLATELSDTKSR